MIYTVYIDVLFLVNLIMDAAVLFLVRLCLNRPAPFRRLLLAAAAGSVWACLATAAQAWDISGLSGIQAAAGGVLKALGGLPGTAAAGAGMAWIAFEWGSTGEKRERIGRLFRETAGLFLGAAILGGVWNGLENLLAGREGRRLSPESLSLAAWAAMGAGAFFTGLFLWKTAQEWVRRRRYLCRVRLAFRGRETETAALLDTGNRLASPDGGRPVHVLEYEVCREICERVDGVIYIPYSCVGRQRGVIPGITLDWMEIIRGEERTKVNRPLVGIVRQPLSPDGSYHMLLNEKSEGE